MTPSTPRGPRSAYSRSDLAIAPRAHTRAAVIVLVLAIATACSARSSGARQATADPSASATRVAPVFQGGRGASTLAADQARSRPHRPTVVILEPGQARQASTFAQPTRVALAEAMVTCAFDWRQTLRSRVEASARYAAQAYAAQLRTISDADRSNWANTQRDHESGRCTTDRAFMISSAPNTAWTKFVRVVLTQVVDTPRTKPETRSFEATYRVQRQSSGRWLIDAEINGGD